MSTLRSFDELPIAGRRVFCRVDFNVPLENGVVSDDTRIRAALPTIERIVEAGGRLVLGSHLGRPKGEANPALSLEPVAQRLAELVSTSEVLLTDDCIGLGARKVVNDLREGQIAILENLRFHSGEVDNDDAFARELLTHCDVYVSDAFGVSHRAHTSVHGLPRLVPDRAPGLLLEKEISALSKLRRDEGDPLVAVLGGSKVSDKIDLIDALLPRLDALLIGGAMANTFLAAQGLSIGDSRIEADKLPIARTIMLKAKQSEVDLLLPVDVVVAGSLDANEGQVVSADAIPEGSMALDVGPETLAQFADRLSTARLLFWNGPMGLFENDAFATGTRSMLQSIEASPAFSVVGGGDSVAAVNSLGDPSRIDHISTGGGASLQYLEGRKLPGLEVLRV